MKQLLLAIALCGLASCGGSNPTTVGTPAPPNSAQTQVLHINQTFSEAIRAAVQTSINLRDAGVITAADTRAVQDWALRVLDVKDAISVELGSADSWTIQKQKILLSLAGFKPPVATSNPILQATLASVLSIVQQMQGQVSQ